MYRIYLCLFITVILVNLFSLGNANISNIPENRLCADAECTAPISEAHGSISYLRENKFMLSFKKGEKMTIIGKADDKKRYWTAKIGDKIGFVPQDLIKEDKIYFANENLSHKVPVEILKEKQSDINSSAPNELEGSLDSSFPNLNNASEQTNETPLSYEVIDGTTFNLDMMQESEEVKPSSTVPVDSTTTKIPESSYVPEPVTESNEDLKSEESSKAPEDDEDDEDYDDDDDDDEDEEEDESKSEEAMNENVVEPEVSEETNENATVNENVAQNDAVNVATEAPIAENEEGWAMNMLDTLAKMVTESQENEADSSPETADLPGNETKPEIVENNIPENLTKTNEVKEEIQIASNTETRVAAEAPLPAEALLPAETPLPAEALLPAEAPLPAEALLPAEAPLTTEAPLVAEAPLPTEAPLTNIENTEKAPLDLPSQDNDIIENIISNEPIETKLPETPETPENLTSTSLNVEVEDMTKVVQLVNDSQGIPTENQLKNELPSVPNKINNFQADVPSTLPEQTISSPENYRQEDSSIPPLLRSFESTTEKVVDDFSHPETKFPQPEIPLETLKTVEITSNFMPMTEAAQVREVTTETYVKQEEVIAEDLNIGQEEAKTENNFDATPEPIQPDENNNEVVKEESGFLSSLLDTVYGYVGLKQKESPDSHADVINEALKSDIIDKSEFEKVEETLQQAVPEGNCKTVIGLESNCEDAPLADETYHIWDSWYSPSRNMDANATFYTTRLYLLITAVTVLLFTLGYYFIEGNRKCTPLIAKVNNLEHQLMVSSAECSLLKDELEATKHKLVLYEDSANNELVITLQAELKEAQKVKSELEATIESLQQELDSATEAGLDLNRMLSEVLTQKGGSDSLMESVERLQTQLDSQQKIIDDMNTSLVMKNQENEGLQVELATSNEKIENLEEELSDIKQNLHILLKEKEDVTSELNSKNHQFQYQIKQLTENKEKEILALKKNSEELTNQLKELSDSLTLKEGELNSLRESVKKIKSNKNFNVDELFDVSRVKAELAKAEKEKLTLKDKLQGEEEARKLLENRMKSADAEVKKLKESYDEAEREKVEAQTKLEVLSKYFKEKEMQLQKELGLQEAMWLQKQGDDTTIYERMTSLQGEIDDYKSQNETLKKEILDQERGLKSQIATLEKKAHENWVAARQAERKLEESKQEAAQLRNRLTMIEKNINNELEAKPNHRLTEEINGGETFSPLMHDSSSPMPFPPMPLDPNNPSLLPPGFIPPPMFIPPPPPMFIPPPPPGGFMPPPPFLPGDRRPPPLGRMSSPPLNNRFSPPSPDYSGDRSPPPLSPPARNYRSPNEPDRERERFRHRTPPFPSYNSRDWEDSHSGGVSGFRPISSQRDSRKDHKGSTLSSGHSSSDSLEKSSRHSGRV